MRKKNKRKRAKVIQAAKPPMICGDPMPVQWAASMPAATTAVITTPEPTPEPFEAEGLAVEKCITALQLLEAEHINAGNTERIKDIVAGKKIKAIELKVEAIENSRPLTWLNGQLNEISKSATTEINRAATIYRSNGMKILDPKIIEASLCTQLGVPEEQMKKSFTAQQLDAATGADYRNYSFHQLLLAAAIENGYDIAPGAGINGGNLRPILQAAFSTHTVSTMLASLGSKSLLAGFDQIPQIWREVAEVVPVSDFKAQTAFRLTTNLEYEELAPGGEIQHGSAGQESYSLEAKTYAKMLSLTRTDIINDDLGAFNNLRKRMGWGAAIALNNAFWTAWLAAADGGAFWTADRGNYESGAGSAFGVAGINASLKAFRNQTLDDGSRLHIEPSRVLVPPDLEATALEFYKSTEVRDTTADTKAGTSNIHYNRFRPVVAPELSSSDFTGYSTTGWWMLPDPAILASAAVCFLGGNEAPTIESADADFNQLGIQFRGFHDFGISMSEYRASVHNVGA